MDIKEIISVELKKKYGETMRFKDNPMDNVVRILNDNGYFCPRDITEAVLGVRLQDLALMASETRNYGEKDDIKEIIVVNIDTFVDFININELPIVYIDFDCPEYIKRVMVEEKELRIKYNELCRFLDTKPNNISEEELDDLESQKAYMNQYLAILQNRINRARKQTLEPVAEFNKGEFVKNLKEIAILAQENIVDFRHRVYKSEINKNMNLYETKALNNLSLRATSFIESLNEYINLFEYEGV